MKEYKVIIAGGRDFSNYGVLKKVLNAFLSNKQKKEIIIVTTRRTGANRLGQQYAAEYGYEVAEFPFEEMLSNKDDVLVNQRMVEFSDACICFSDGANTDVHKIIALSQSAQLETWVVDYSCINLAEPIKKNRDLPLSIGLVTLTLAIYQ